MKVNYIDVEAGGVEPPCGICTRDFLHAYPFGKFRACFLAKTILYRLGFVLIPDAFKTELEV